MSQENKTPEFEVLPARPAPSESFVASPKVVAKIAEMLPAIQEIKSSANMVS